jgi:hypothetical protein
MVATHIELLKPAPISVTGIDWHTNDPEPHPATPTFDVSVSAEPGTTGAELLFHAYDGSDKPVLLFRKKLSIKGAPKDGRVTVVVPVRYTPETPADAITEIVLILKDKVIQIIPVLPDPQIIL